MVKRLAESSQCYKTGEGWYNQGKFEVDSLYNTKLKVTKSRLSPGVLVEEFK